MFWNKKLALKISTFVSVAVFVLFVLCATVITVYMNGKTEENSYSQLQLQAQNISLDIDSFLNEQFTAVKLYAKTQDELATYFTEWNDASVLDDYTVKREVQIILNNIKDAIGTDVQSIWIADKSGNFVVSNTGNIVSSGYSFANQSWANSINGKTACITKVENNLFADGEVVSVVAPVFDSLSNTVGALGFDINTNVIVNAVKDYKIGNDGYVVVFDSNDNIVYHPNNEYIGKTALDAEMSTDISTCLTNNETGTFSYKIAGDTGYAAVENIDVAGWSVLAHTSQDDFTETTREVLYVMSVVFIVALLVIMAVVAVLGYAIAKPIINLTAAATEISNGNLSVSISTKSQDETGKLAAAMASTVSRLQAYINYIDEISETLDTMAKGQLDITLKYDYVGDFAKIKDSLYGISRELTHTISDINHSSEQVARLSEQVAGASQALSQGATQQASAIEELSATIADISDQVKKNAEHSHTAAEISKETEAEVAEGNQKMSEMLDAMTEIENTSNEIGKIIKTIDDIAFQTNILALNAAVEAARAGAAGKGFAVVADEVRNLASKSAEAAKNTSQLIEGSIRAVQNGAKIADATSTSLKKIVESANQVSDIVQNISNASGEQAEAIQQVTQGIEQISAVVQTNSATSEESAATSQELSHQANMLKGQVGKFVLSKTAGTPAPATKPAPAAKPASAPAPAAKPAATPAPAPAPSSAPARSTPGAPGGFVLTIDRLGYTGKTSMAEDTPAPKVSAPSPKPAPKAAPASKPQGGGLSIDLGEETSDNTIVKFDRSMLSSNSSSSPKSGAVETVEMDPDTMPIIDSTEFGKYSR